MSPWQSPLKIQSPSIYGGQGACHEPSRPDDVVQPPECHTPAMRKFNTEGPVIPADHYCIPPLERVNLGRILELNLRMAGVWHSGGWKALFEVRVGRPRQAPFRCPVGR